MHASDRTPRALVYLGYAACCLLWGSTWMGVKVGLEDLPPLRFAAARMAVALAILTPFVLRQGFASASRRELAWLLGLGLLQIGAVFSLQFVAQQWIPSGLSAILFATFAAWVQLASRLWLPGYRLTGAGLLAVALGIGGVAVLQLPSLEGMQLADRALAGSALMVLDAVVCAVANVLVRRHLSRVAPLLLTWGQILGGTAVLAGLAALEAAAPGAAPAHWTPRAAGALAYLSLFGTVTTYLIFFWLMPRLSMAAIGTIPLLDTTVAVLLGTAFLGEPLRWEILVGGALVLGSVALANLKGGGEQPAAAGGGAGAAA